MLRNLGSNGLYDERMIDDRNTRPLTIAFATIVMVWMLAFGIVSVSAQFGARSHHMAVRSHLGLRISNFTPKEPSNVRMIAKEYSRV